MKKGLVVLGVLVLVAIAYFTAGPGEKMISGSIKGGEGSLEKTGQEEDSTNETHEKTQVNEEGQTSVTSGAKTTKVKEEDQGQAQEIRPVVYGKKFQKDPQLQIVNKEQVLKVIPGLQFEMNRQECAKIIKTKKGADFTCRAKVYDKKIAGVILQESSYKKGKMVSFESKVNGAKELVSFQSGVLKRRSTGKRRARKSKEKAAQVVKFAFEGIYFMELYLDGNYMTDEFQYHYFDFKQAILEDEFYKERDFQERLDLLVNNIAKSMKLVKFQCEKQKFSKACLAYKNFKKINLKKDARKIIDEAEASKLESAFFD